MEREIKFRGKRINSDKWAYGFLIRFHDGESWIMAEKGTSGVLDTKVVQPTTLGQYTGYKDQNGVEVYEGDILSLSKFKYEVQYSEKDSWKAAGINDEYLYDLRITLEFGAVVTGNIHD